MVLLLDTVLLDTDLVITLDLGTILGTIVMVMTIVMFVIIVTIVSLSADSLTTTGPTFSFVITAVSSSVLTSLRSVFPIGGTPTITTDTLMGTPLTITRLYTMTTGIGTVYPLQCKRSLPGAVTTTVRLTERSAPAAAKPFERFKRQRDYR